jgi:hypothetical protein
MACDFGMSAGMSPGPQQPGGASRVCENGAGENSAQEEIRKAGNVKKTTVHSPLLQRNGRRLAKGQFLYYSYNTWRDKDYHSFLIIRGLEWWGTAV